MPRPCIPVAVACAVLAATGRAAAANPHSAATNATRPYTWLQGVLSATGRRSRAPLAQASTHESLESSEAQPLNRRRRRGAGAAGLSRRRRASTAVNGGRCDGGCGSGCDDGCSTCNAGCDTGWDMFLLRPPGCDEACGCDSCDWDSQPCNADCKCAIGKSLFPLFFWFVGTPPAACAPSTPPARHLRTYLYVWVVLLGSLSLASAYLPTCACACPSSCD